ATPVQAADATVLRQFVAAGGRLVVGGPAGTWLRRIVPDAPAWSPAAPRKLAVLTPTPEIARVDRVDAPGSGSWSGGAALPVLGDEERALLDAARVGAGRALLLANAAPLQNRRLDVADDAELGLALAGSPARPVVFLESYHGYGGGSSSGLAAVPRRW